MLENCRAELVRCGISAEIPGEHTILHHRIHSSFNRFCSRILVE